MELRDGQKWNKGHKPMQPSYNLLGMGVEWMTKPSEPQLYWFSPLWIPTCPFPAPCRVKIHRRVLPMWKWPWYHPAHRVSTAFGPMCMFVISGLVPWLLNNWKTILPQVSLRTFYCCCYNLDALFEPDISKPRRCVSLVICYMQISKSGTDVDLKSLG